MSSPETPSAAWDSVGGVERAIRAGALSPKRGSCGRLGGIAPAGRRPIARIKFERMKAHTEDILSEILDFLGVSRDGAAIRQAVANNNLQRMKEKGDRAPQTSPYSRESGNGDQKRFIRSGSTGGWRSRVTQAQVQLIERHAGAGLTRMGYSLETARSAVGELLSKGMMTGVFGGPQVGLRRQ